MVRVRDADRDSLPDRECFRPSRWVQYHKCLGDISFIPEARLIQWDRVVAGNQVRHVAHDHAS